MELKAVIALTPGTVVAEDVLDHKGNVIVKKNTALDKYLIQKLNIANITCINVKEPEDFLTTYFEKIKVSRTFKQFYEIYSKNFFEYKDMMQKFLKEKVPIDPNRLYEIIDDITSPFRHSKITILDMLTVLETAEVDFLYTHSINVALICNYTAKWFRLDEEDSKALVLCGFFYDIGKFVIPQDILLRQGRLSDEEFDLIKSHAVKGYQMLQMYDIDERIKLCALMHHERIDGSGYPKGLVDEQINQFAKIIAILDSYEAMTSYRSYRAPLCPFKVIEIFEKDGYGKYDTGCYMTFLERMVEEYIGKEVQLNDGTVCVVVLINKQRYSRPMVKTEDGKYIDLASQKNLSIVALV
ncbi:MAG: HD-GYP domain-containing protein [Lachnospiraceae bacterium]|nr:HD-GYP domain-containing protein [Lachnospiraceae bacterium]